MAKFDLKQNALKYFNYLTLDPKNPNASLSLRLRRLNRINIYMLFFFFVPYYISQKSRHIFSYSPIDGHSRPFTWQTPNFVSVLDNAFLTFFCSLATMAAVRFFHSFQCLTTWTSKNGWNTIDFMIS